MKKALRYRKEEKRREGDQQPLAAVREQPPFLFSASESGNGGVETE